ncbi:MAG: diaminopimelate epimerase [Bacteroidetes bacterium]|nr:diaminopimelate epimerase [Bacteroidota bacterium]
MNEVKIEQSGWATFVAMHRNFWKWEGTGNDFILLDRREWPEMPAIEVIGQMCDRVNSVGADGVIFFQPLTKLDHEGRAQEWEMDYLNADGSRSFCGNGSRALFTFLLEQGWIGNQGVLRAFDGEHRVQWDESLELPGVEMRPIAIPQMVPSQMGLREAEFLDTGSPHHLEWVEELTGLDVDHWGKCIRNSLAYAPAGTNVDFLKKKSDDALEMRTYERGVEAETRACGTGAVAAAVSDFHKHGGSLTRRIDMQGGRLTIRMKELEKDSNQYTGIWLFGAAKQLKKGFWNGSQLLTSIALLLLLWGMCIGDLKAKSANSIWSDQLEISVLTGSPGSDLYSAWGHTAIRVKDFGQVPAVDLTYNYGTFEFGDGFYLNFLKGDLNYRLARSSFGSFQQEYLHTGRAILEQPLELSIEDARSFVEYLEWNYLPENRTYAYLFFEDNCSSRVLALLGTIYGDRWDSGCEHDAVKGVTYRSALRPYMEGDEWIEWGIDFLLGPRSDREMPPCASSFLPDYLMHQIQQGRLEGKPIAGAPVELIPAEGSWFRSIQNPYGIGPKSVSWLLLAWSVLWSLRRMVQRRRGVAVPIAERLAGKSVQFLAFTLGVLLLMMWFLTNHKDTWANWNLIWASPLLGLVFSTKKKEVNWRMWVRFGLSTSILLFLLSLPFALQFVSLSSVLLAWAVWISLDPWDLPLPLLNTLKRR